MTDASGPKNHGLAAPNRGRREASRDRGPPPQILVLAAQATGGGAQVRDILLAVGDYAVSLDRTGATPADLIIPILTPDQDPLTALTQLRAEMPEAKLLPILHDTHLTRVLDRPLPGVIDFLVGPVRKSELLTRVRRLLPLSAWDDANRAQDRLQESVSLDQLRGVDPAFLAVKQRILRVAKTDVTVLVTGKTGTGKELAARAIHYLSARAGKPFMPVNCGAIPADLFENELFGHHRGAFTDARSYQRGIVAEAEGGTLFLDEIDTLTPPAQIKLLRFLDDRTYRPLGSPRMLEANARLVAATNIDLTQKVAEGTFRDDLFHRLHVVTLHLQPLRERAGDIPLLAEHFLERHAPTPGRWRFSPEALELLREYEWPGNVRELENVVQQVIVLNPPKLIEVGDLPLPVRPIKVDPVPASFSTAKARAIARFERSYLTELLQNHRGNITRAARAARQDRRTFRRLIQKHHLKEQTW